MSETKICLKGFTPDEAVWRLLQKHGYEESIVSFRDKWHVDGTPESMILPLEANAMQARMATVNADELCFLKFPVLLQNNDMMWMLALRKRNDRIYLETAEGELQIKTAALASHLSGHVLDINAALPEETTIRKRFEKLLALNKNVAFQIIVATVIMQLLSLAMPEITSVVMNRALPDGASNTLRLVAAGVILCAFFQAWTGWLRARVILYLSVKISISMEQGFLNHLLRLPFPILQRKTLGEMLQAYLGIVAADSQLVEKGIGALLDGVLSLTFLISMSQKLLAPTFVIIAAAIVMVVLVVIIGRIQAALQQKQVDAQARQHGFLTELLSGCKVVKAAGAEQRCIKRWISLFRKELSLELKKERIGLWAEIGIDTLLQAITVTILIWGGHHCLNNKVNIGSLFAFMQLANGFLSSIFNVTAAYLTLCVIRPQLVKTQEILSTTPRKSIHRLSSTACALTKPVIMEDVWFRYAPDMPWILKGFNLIVKPGDKYTLKSESGSGKSTILRLLAGLYTPEKGMISINGIPPSAAQHQTLYLPQFTRLYVGSILENLRILSGGASWEHIIDAARITGLHDMVAALPMNYNTILPPGGYSLSGGQRQLVIMAAAIASKKPFILLDEATANIDGHASEKIMALVNREPWTAVMAAHVG